MAGAVALEFDAQVQRRRTEYAAKAQRQAGEAVPRTTVAVVERVDRLGLRVGAASTTWRGAAFRGMGGILAHGDGHQDAGVFDAGIMSCNVHG